MLKIHQVREFSPKVPILNTDFCLTNSWWYPNGDKWIVLKQCDSQSVWLIYTVLSLSFSMKLRVLLSFAELPSSPSCVLDDASLAISYNNAIPIIFKSCSKFLAHVTKTWKECKNSKDTGSSYNEIMRYKSLTAKSQLTSFYFSIFLLDGKNYALWIVAHFRFGIFYILLVRLFSQRFTLSPRITSDV